MKQILGYTDKLTVRPGDEIAFKISAPEGTAYRAQLVRLVNGDVHSKAAAFKEIEIAAPINGTYKAHSQPIATGSCVVIEDTHPLEGLDSLTVALTFLPTAPQLGRQHLISRWDQSANTGWSMHLEHNQRLCFTTVDHEGRNSTVRAACPLEAKHWYRAAVRINWASQSVTLDCLPVTPVMQIAGEGSRDTAAVGKPPALATPLLIAAGLGGRSHSGRCVPVDSFNGRIEAPVIYQGLLSDAELEAVMSGARPVSLAGRLVGDWDFSLGIGGATVEDRSPNRLDGYTHNLPLRGVRGSRWDGSEMSWRHAPEQYGAIHFHTDDLYDCDWQTAISYTVPPGLRSGIYALRLRLKDESAATVEEPHEEYLPFFVAAPQGRPQAELAFLVPTHTYLAYGNVRVWDAKRAESGLSKEEYYAPIWTGPGNGDYSVLLSEHPNLGSSTYDHHLDGSPVHTSSWLRPLLNLRPKSVLWTFCADLLLTDWLEFKGAAYDIITDDLLHAEGLSLLRNYRVVMTGNHPEYHTTTQLDALESYLGEGGRLMYMGGNGFYWRCAANAMTPGAIEVRRGRTGTGMWTSEVGEDSLAFSGEQGGICRDIGRPPQRLVGVGFIAQGHDDSHYRILPGARASRAAFILEGVEGDVVGDFGIFGSAVGQEIDKTNPVHGTPAHTVVLARSVNHGVGMVYVIEEMSSVDPVIAHYEGRTCAEVIFFETPRGGAVFAVGSMAWCGSLSHNGYDNSIATMTGNALRRLLDPAPFALPRCVTNPGSELLTEKACGEA